MLLNEILVGDGIVENREWKLMEKTVWDEHECRPGAQQLSNGTDEFVKEFGGETTDLILTYPSLDCACELRTRN